MNKPNSTKDKDLTAEELEQQIEYWKKECEIYRKRYGYSCKDCFRESGCEQAYQQIKALIEQSDKDEEWLVEKMSERKAGNPNRMSGREKEQKPDKNTGELVECMKALERMWDDANEQTYQEIKRRLEEHELIVSLWKEVEREWITKPEQKLVPKEFLEKWASKMFMVEWYHRGRETWFAQTYGEVASFKELISEMLTELGHEAAEQNEP